MNHAEFLAAVDADSRRLIDIALANLDVSLMCNDDWSMRDLVAHIGGVWSFVIANVAASSTEPSPPGERSAAPDGDTIGPWIEERRSALLDQFAARSADDAAWTFGNGSTVGWWARRMAHETVIHRVDAEDGVNDRQPIHGDLAADGINEYLEVGLVSSTRRPNRTYPPKTLHLHRTDGPGEWMLQRGSTENEVVVTHEHEKGDAAIRGSAMSLDLWVWGRSVDDVEVFGDADVAAAWQAMAP